MTNEQGILCGLSNVVSSTEGAIPANILELNNGVLIAGGNVQGEENCDKLMRSIDGGENWTQVLDIENIQQSFTAPFLASNGYVYFGTVYSVGNGLAKLYRSKDEGATWELVLTSQSSAFWHFAEDRHQNIYAAEYSWGIQDANEHYGQGIWRTTDNGDTWVRWFIHPTAPNTAPDYRNSIRHIHAIWIDPFDDQLYASFGEESPAYYDGGKTYKINNNGTLGELLQEGGNGMTGVTRATTGAVFYGDDREAFTIYRLENGVKSTVFNALTDFGVSPGPMLSMGTGNDGVIYAFPNDCSQGQVFASYDDGKSWGVLKFTVPGKQEKGFVNKNGTSSKVYISTRGNYVSIKDYTRAELKTLFSSTATIKQS